MELELIPGLMNEMALECLIRIHPFDRFQSMASVSKSWTQKLHTPEFHNLRKSSNLTHPITVLAQAITQPNNTTTKSLPTYWLTAIDPESSSSSSSSSWTRLPPCPSLPNGLPLFSTLVSCNSRLFILGGWDPITFQVTKSVHIFDFLTGTWSLGSPIPGPSRSLFGAASDNQNTILIAGGHDNEKRALRSAFAYDIATDQWIPLPDMSTERDECTVVYQSGHHQFRVVSGYPTDRQGCFVKSAESFNPTTWTWNPAIFDDFVRSGGVRCCVVGVDDDQKVYSCQGGVVAQLTTSTTTDNNNTKCCWHALAHLGNDQLSSSSSLSVHHLAAWRGKLMLVGSTTSSSGNCCDDGKMTMGVHVYDKETKKWCQLPVPADFTGHVQSGCVLEL